ncbi:MAG: SpoIVB peptidase [Desulfocucumaceae bacterium]
MEKEYCRKKTTFISKCFLAVLFCLLAYSEIIITHNSNINTELYMKMLQSKTFHFYQVKALITLPSLKTAVSSDKPIYVIPGGQSIGILMRSKGVIVVGISEITDGAGKCVKPAEKAGIRIGDLILSINGSAITDEFQLKKEIKRAGSQEDIVLEIKREGKVSKVKVRAVVCSDTEQPRIGLFVRDSASGVGTLSFYHPESKTYGALGHIITDIDTAQGIELSDGRIMEANVKAIHRGNKGRPGEKIGMLVEDGSISGNIEKNTRVGIFGKISSIEENPFFKNSVPVALSSEIKKGSAEMYTVIEGSEIKSYSVEIQEVIFPWNNKGKGMVIRVTDPDLIKNTGGIIQGMSGSPIIQDGKLIGVITHVFINDPQKGYGVPAEWMLREIGIIYDKPRQNVS